MLTDYPADTNQTDKNLRLLEADNEYEKPDIKQTKHSMDPLEKSKAKKGRWRILGRGVQFKEYS